HAFAAHSQGAGDRGEAWCLAPGGDEGAVGQEVGGPAAFPEASPGGEGVAAGVVVELAGGAEGSEVLAGGGFRDAELGGEVSQGEGAAAASAFLPGQQLQRVDGGGGTAPAVAGRAQAGELRGFGAEGEVQAGGD